MLWDKSSRGFLGRIRAELKKKKKREILESRSLDPVVHHVQGMMRIIIPVF